jgi:nickel transport protein
MPNKWLFASRKLPACWLQGILVILVLAVYTTPALAHRVIVFAYAEGDTINTESKFVPDTPVRQGKIEVMDKKTGKVLLTGQTDDQGKFSFKIPAAAVAQKLDLEIVVEAAMGHRGAWLLKAASYLPGAVPGKAAAPAAPTPVSATTPAAASGSKTANIDQQALEAALNKALMRQRGPINEKLTDLTIHRTSLPDVLGGIGYILGLFGLWAYFQSKGKKNP